MLFIALPSLETILRGSYGWLLNSSAGLWEVLPSFCLCVEPRGLMWFYVSFCFEAGLLPAFVLSGAEFGYLAPVIYSAPHCKVRLVGAFNVAKKGRRCVASRGGSVLPRRKAPTMDHSQSLRHWRGQERSSPLMGWEEDIIFLGQAPAAWERWWGTRRQQGGGRPKRSFSGRIAACLTGGCTDKTWESLENNSDEVVQ